MNQVLDRLEQAGSREEAAVLRAQLERIIPAQWEDEFSKE